jgi:hypothetical protein
MQLMPVSQSSRREWLLNSPVWVRGSTTASPGMPPFYVMGEISHSVNGGWDFENAMIRFSTVRFVNGTSFNGSRVSKELCFLSSEGYEGYLLKEDFQDFVNK